MLFMVCYNIIIVIYYNIITPLLKIKKFSEVSEYIIKIVYISHLIKKM